jgi:hypothetical protein
MTQLVSEQGKDTANRQTNRQKDREKTGFSKGFLEDGLQLV